MFQFLVYVNKTILHNSDNYVSFFTFKHLDETKNAKVIFKTFCFQYIRITKFNRIQEENITEKAFTFNSDVFVHENYSAFVYYVNFV